MLVADLGQSLFIVTPDDLAAVRLPTLAIAGLDSDPFLQSTPRVIAASVASAEVVEFPACRHVTYAEQPDAFASAVRECLPSIRCPTIEVTSASPSPEDCASWDDVVSSIH